MAVATEASAAAGVAASFTAATSATAITAGAAVATNNATYPVAVCVLADAFSAATVIASAAPADATTLKPT